ncbi:MAG: glycosyltransferase family 39 protein [Chloroflexota bacterium]
MTLFIMFTMLAIPRTLNLSWFLTGDEILWINRSLAFFRALQSEAWLQTYQTGHPGVTTMWTGSLGYWMSDHFLNTALVPITADIIAWCTVPLQLLPYLRLSTIFITLITILISARLTYRLFGRETSLIFLALLLLDPIYLAHSRILHHDALVASFMLISGLSLLVYLFCHPKYGYLLLSAIGAGLALLSKSTAVFLIPFVGLVIMVQMGMNHRLKGATLRLRSNLMTSLIWIMLCGIVIYDFWPAMWVSPQTVLRGVVQTSQTYGSNPHAHGLFFWGATVPDPGIAYYLVSFLFMTTPLVILGAIIAMGWGLFQAYTKQPITRSGILLILLALYILCFIVMLGLGEKKQARYLLPALLIVNLLAAWGLNFIIRWINSVLQVQWKLQRLLPSYIFYYGLGSIIVVQCFTSIPHHPYYFTYANPLLGGGQVAGQFITVGWGEGLDEAARYLNNKPNADSLTVSTWLSSPFAPYFRGHTLYHPRSPGLALASDYTVLYLSEVQRGVPNAQLQDAIRTYGHLEKIINIKGVDYAWIYKMPKIKPVILPNEPWAAQTTILGYEFLEKKRKAGDTITVRLYNQIQAQGRTETLALHLINQQKPISTTFEFDLTQQNATGVPGQIQTRLIQVQLPTDLPAGLYCPHLTKQEAYQATRLDEDYLNQNQCGYYKRNHHVCLTIQ